MKEEKEILIAEEYKYDYANEKGYTDWLHLKMTIRYSEEPEETNNKLTEAYAIYYHKEMLSKLDVSFCECGDQKHIECKYCDSCNKIESI